MPRIYVSGVSGSGKTTACNFLITNHPEITFINSSQLLLDLLGLKDRQQLKEVSNEQLEDIRKNIFPKIFLEYSNLIVDGHLNLNQRMVDCFNSFISIEASSEKILSNRQSELSRDRSLDLASIDQEILSYRRKLDSVKLRFPIKPITLHNEGSIKDLSNELYSAYLDLEKDQEIKSEIYRQGKEF